MSSGRWLRRFSARSSIWRARSVETPSFLPAWRSVCGSSSPGPKRSSMTLRSRSGSSAIAAGGSARAVRDLLVDRPAARADSSRRTTVSPSSPTGWSRRDHGAVRLADLDHLGERQSAASAISSSLGSWPSLVVELSLDASDLPRALRHVDREADRAAGVLQPALDRLPDPQRRVRGEPEALAPVELLDRADQAQHALLDEVAEGQALALVAPRVGDDQAEVRVDHAVLGGQVAALDPLGQLDLLLRREQRVPARLAQEELQRVERRVRLMLHVPAGTRRFNGGARSGSFHVLSPTRVVGIIGQNRCSRNHPVRADGLVRTPAPRRAAPDQDARDPYA